MFAGAAGRARPARPARRATTSTSCRSTAGRCARESGLQLVADAARPTVGRRRHPARRPAATACPPPPTTPTLVAAVARAGRPGPARRRRLQRRVPARRRRPARRPPGDDPLGPRRAASPPRHPDVDVDADPIWTRDGDVWTSAGVTAGIDLALALVEDDHGVDVAETFARWLVMFLRRPGGQSQFAAPVWRHRARDEPVRRAQELIEADPAADHRLGVLARQVAMSERHFLRRFTAEVGVDAGPLRRHGPRRRRPARARGERRHRRRDRRPRRLRHRRVDAPHVRPRPRRRRPTTTAAASRHHRKDHAS